MQAGPSSIPDKISLALPEAVNQVAFAMIGDDVAVTTAVEAGQLQVPCRQFDLTGHDPSHACPERVRTRRVTEDHAP